MKIGVIGGGQLGRMLALAGTPLGMSFAFLDPAPDACAQALGLRTQGGAAVFFTAISWKRWPSASRAPCMLSWLP